MTYAKYSIPVDKTKDLKKVTRQKSCRKKLSLIILYNVIVSMLVYRLLGKALVWDLECNVCNVCDVVSIHLFISC